MPRPGPPRLVLVPNVASKENVQSKPVMKNPLLAWREMLKKSAAVKKRIEEADMQRVKKRRTGDDIVASRDETRDRESATASKGGAKKGAEEYNPDLYKALTALRHKIACDWQNKPQMYKQVAVQQIVTTPVLKRIAARAPVSVGELRLVSGVTDESLCDMLWPQVHRDDSRSYESQRL